jgi:hypothetical protein
MTTATNNQCPSVASLGEEKHDLSSFALQAAVLKGHFFLLGDVEWKQDVMTEERHQWSVKTGDTDITIGVTEINMYCSVLSPRITQNVTIPLEMCEGCGIPRACMAKTFSRLISNVPHLSAMSRAYIVNQITGDLIDSLIENLN